MELICKVCSVIYENDIVTSSKSKLTSQLHKLNVIQQANSQPFQIRELTYCKIKSIDKSK